MLTALSVGEQLICTPAEVDRLCDHIVMLLSSSATLLREGDAGSAAFLAITALEETAKAHVGMWRGPGDPVERRKDVLYSHKKKHELGAAPTVAMGRRLSEAIGSEQVAELMRQARAGELVSLRERCLYFSRTGNEFLTPSDFLNPERARQLLLFSIEAFDDALIGYTNYSMTLSKRTDELFANVAA